MASVHSRAARAARAELGGAASSSEASAADAALRLGLDRSYISVDELLADDGIDIVHICTPNTTHAALALAALDAGKHVICEKPLATTVTDAVTLTERAAERGLTATVPFVYRYHPMVREARDRVQTGTSGAIRLIHGGYLQDWLLKASDDNWRVDESIGGASRAFADIGSHWCDLAEFVSGHRITRVSARTYGTFPERATEDAVIMQFETDKGAVGSTVISQISAGRKNQLTLEIDEVGTHALREKMRAERTRTERA
jgi:predicted dehydrogenase